MEHWGGARNVFIVAIMSISMSASFVKTWSKSLLESGWNWYSVGLSLGCDGLPFCTCLEVDVFMGLGISWAGRRKR